jgi:NitT/TauT family transport system substrate-binding protein
MGMFFSDYGLQSYGNVVAAHNDLIKENPTLVKQFVQATIKGLAYSFEHPEEAVSMLVKMNPVIDSEGALGELCAIRDTWTDVDKRSGLGFMTPEKTRASVDNITTALELAKPDSLDVVYSDQFVK